MMVGLHVRRLIACGALSILAACSANEVILEGERIPIRAVDETSIDKENLPAVQLSKAVTNSEWTHENGNTRHSAGHLAGSYPLQPLWSASVGRGASRSGRITSGPIVAEDRVYTLDAAARVTAFSGFGEVVAMEPDTGEVIWRQKLDAPVRAAPTVTNGMAYVVSRNDQAFAIDLKNGRIRWRIAGVDPEAGVVGGASPATIDGLVVLPFASGEVVGTLARNGRRVWTSVISGGRRGHSRARLSDITGDPVIAGDTIYVANQSGRLVALDRRSGERKWSVNEGSLGPALPIGGSLFFVTDQAQLKRLDASNGKALWSVQLPQFPDPEELGSTPIGGGGAAAQPAIAQGTLFVVSRDGTLFAFK